jgi:hypothetical protein
VLSDLIWIKSAASRALQTILAKAGRDSNGNAVAQVFFLEPILILASQERSSRTKYNAARSNCDEKARQPCLSETGPDALRGAWPLAVDRYAPIAYS